MLCWLNLCESIFATTVQTSNRFSGMRTAHDVEHNGHYDFWIPPSLNIWTHTWSNAGCKAEACVIFSLEFDWKTASVRSVMLRLGYDWECFLDELARLEMAALGTAVYGKSRYEPTT